MISCGYKKHMYTFNLQSNYIYDINYKWDSYCLHNLWKIILKVVKMFILLLAMINIVFSTSYQIFYVSLWYNYNIINKLIQLVLPFVILLWWYLNIEIKLINNSQTISLIAKDCILFEIEIYCFLGTFTIGRKSFFIVYHFRI